MENNIQGKKINARSLSSILTICMLICLFVAFVLGTICAQFILRGIDLDAKKAELEWSICGPYLAFMILAFLLAIVKFFVCTRSLKKEYPSKDTIKIQFWMEILQLVVLLLGCISLAFIQPYTSEMGGLIVGPRSVVGVVIVSTLAFAFGAATSGLAYHNYK